MTNAWSFLHDELYGESKMTESLIGRNDGPVGSSGDDIITFNTLDVSVPELPETPENSNGFWKYHEDIILKEIRLARNLNATHLAITHFDEISNATKLWPILFEHNLSPLCICNGQNVTGDFSTNVMNQMITKTFPEELYSRSFKHFKHKTT